MLQFPIRLEDCSQEEFFNHLENRQAWAKDFLNKILQHCRRSSTVRAEGHYALEGLSNKVLAAEYQTVLPDEKVLAEELERSREELEGRRLAAPIAEGEA